jgi:iron(III) transport system substrate-binding protein
VRPASHARPLLIAALVASTVAACTGAASSPDPGASAGAPSPAAGGSLTVYSGRSEELVAPVIEQFEAVTGIDAEVRYAGTSELAATILEEGDNSPADVFFSQDGGALGALGAEGRLATLPQNLLDRVDARFRADDGSWVGVTGRARVLAYDTREFGPEDLPASVLDLADPAWRGRVGWVPTNASFQTFVTALRETQGDEATLEWLERMQANEPRVYDGNAAALQAVAAGEIDVAIINHYYLLQAEAESGTELPVANHFFASGDPGALVNVAGVGILEGAEHAAEAEAFARYLLDEEAQAYFSGETFEYPLAGGAAPDPRLPALADIQSPELDLSDLDDLAGTLRLLQDAGIL